VDKLISFHRNSSPPTSWRHC